MEIIGLIGHQGVGKNYIAENSINKDEFNFENFINTLNEIADLEILVEKVKDYYSNATVENLSDFFNLISLIDTFASQDKNSFKIGDYPYNRF